MRKILIAGCAQEISSFNPVKCKYEIFHILKDKEINEYHNNKNSYMRWNNAFMFDPLMPNSVGYMASIVLFP